MRHHHVRKGVVLILGAILSGALLGCVEEVPYTQGGAGYFPPGSSYQTCLYRATVGDELHGTGSFFDLLDRRVWVDVYDQKDRQLLHDDIGMMRAHLVVGRTTWATFDDLEVRLYDVIGDGSAEYEEVTVEPHAPHAKLLRRLHYRFDKASGKFVRVE